MFNLYENNSKRGTCLTLHGPPAGDVVSKYYVKTSHKSFNFSGENLYFALKLLGVCT
jgi:hypothetical protein